MRKALTRVAGGTWARAARRILAIGDVHQRIQIHATGVVLAHILHTPTTVSQGRSPCRTIRRRFAQGVLVGKELGGETLVDNDRLFARQSIGFGEGPPAQHLEAEDAEIVRPDDEAVDRGTLVVLDRRVALDLDPPAIRALERQVGSQGHGVHAWDGRQAGLQPLVRGSAAGALHELIERSVGPA